MAGDNIRKTRPNFEVKNVDKEGVIYGKSASLFMRVLPSVKPEQEWWSLEIINNVFISAICLFVYALLIFFYMEFLKIVYKVSHPVRFKTIKCENSLFGGNKSIFLSEM